MPQRYCASSNGSNPHSCALIRYLLYLNVLGRAVRAWFGVFDLVYVYAPVDLAWLAIQQCPSTRTGTPSQMNTAMMSPSHQDPHNSARVQTCRKFFKGLLFMCLSVLPCDGFKGSHVRISCLGSSEHSFPTVYLIANKLGGLSDQQLQS